MARQLLTETVLRMRFAPFRCLLLLYAPPGPASIVILDKIRFLFSRCPVVQPAAGGLHSLDGKQLLHRDESHPLGL